METHTAWLHADSSKPCINEEEEYRTGVICLDDGNTRATFLFLLTNDYNTLKSFLPSTYRGKKNMDFPQFQVSFAVRHVWPNDVNV